jgi:hypothetical protein
MVESHASSPKFAPMISPSWFIFSLIVLVLAYLSASYHSQQGYPFWRTFILSVMGFTGLGLFVFKLLIGA